MNETVVEKLFAKYEQKGFLSNDEILSELISSNVSLVQTERICSELLSRGVLISDEKPVFENAGQSQKFDYDKAHIDYEKLFGKIITKEPNLEFLVDYVRKIKPPQLHEVEKLYPQIQAGNQFARKRLFEMNMRVALKFAYQKAKEFHLSLEDTVQDAMIGLWTSIEKFDLSKHDKFQGYSTFWILNFINRNKNIGESLISIPAHFQEEHEKIFKYLSENHGEFFANPILTDDLIFEISTYFNIPKETIERHLFLLSPILDEGKIEGTHLKDFSEEVLNNVLGEKLNTIIDELKPKEREVIKFRFGLYRKTDSDYDNKINLVNEKIYTREGEYGYSQTLTLEEVASLYGLTRERIRQIESKALKKLQIRLEKLIY